MEYKFQKDLESGLSVPVPIDLLQPIQMGLCKESLDYWKNDEIIPPNIITPVKELGIYAFVDGTHRTFNEYKKGKKEANSILYTPEIAMEYFGETKEKYDEYLETLPLTIKFVREAIKIYTVKDLEKRIFSTKKEMINLEESLFSRWKELKGY